jgi:Trypsin-like peptidase domain
MPDLATAIPLVRRSTVAILRIQLERPQSVKKGKVRPAKFRVSFGSAFCIVENRYLLTACHVLGAGEQPRNQSDKFYAFLVPHNGDAAHYFPIVSFPIERPELDLAVIEIGPCATAGMQMPAVPITSNQKPDGDRVVTVGFPTPEIVAISIDPDLNYMGGQFFLKSHANEGIVSAQYLVNGLLGYELNVGWHNGESGGPIASLGDPLAVFSLMQHYRNIQSPHGIVAGPHRGIALSAIQQELGNLGAVGV